MSSEPSYQFAVVPGMRVANWTHHPTGHVVGVCQNYCVYRLENGHLCVANWRDLAIAGLHPAPQVLPADVEGNDKRNASAVLLKELLYAEQFGWSETQRMLRDELVAYLCPSVP